MKAPDNKELIAGMAELLKAHEEPYEQGSWEGFLAQQQNKKPRRYLWIAYAAALAMMMALAALFFNPSPQKSSEMAKTLQPKPPVAEDIENLKEVPTALEPGPSKAARIALAKSLSSTPKGEMPIALPAKEVAVTPVNEQFVAVNRTEKEETVKPKNPVIAEPKRSADLMEFLTNESAKVVSNHKTQPSKWDFGIEVAPTLVDSKLSLGAGITTAYRISERISLSTGIAYVSLDAEERVNNQPVSLMSSKKLTTIDANIRAIDIPLAVTYHLNKKLYTSVGVSYFGVISEQRNNNYLTEMAISRTSADPETGKIETFQTTLLEKNVEPAVEQPLSGNSYLGFFNFSVGHVQPLHKNHKIILEPFIKIPLGKLSDDDLKLSNGGIKLRYSF